MEFLIWYICIGIGILIVNALIAGYTGNAINRVDFTQSLIWPVYVAMLIGAVTRIYVEKYKENK